MRFYDIINKQTFTLQSVKCEDTALFLRILLDLMNDLSSGTHITLQRYLLCSNCRQGLLKNFKISRYGRDVQSCERLTSSSMEMNGDKVSNHFKLGRWIFPNPSSILRSAVTIGRQQNTLKLTIFRAPVRYKLSKNNKAGPGTNGHRNNSIEIRQLSAVRGSSPITPHCAATIVLWTDEYRRMFSHQFPS